MDKKADAATKVDDIRIKRYKLESNRTDSFYYFSSFFIVE